jgi:signal transduction histidine kinase/phage shock protein PspC (stress-responsive transcriptional regulator)
MATASADPPSFEERLRAIRRAPQDAWISGVCAGIARAFGVDVLVVRIAFIAAATAAGVGVIAYVVAYALIPSGPAPVAPPAAVSAGRSLRASFKEVAGIALLVLAGLLALREIGIWWSDVIVWPVVLTSAGVALIWRQSTVAPASAAANDAGPSPARAIRTPLGELPSFGPRLVGGAVLVAAGVVTLLQTTDVFGTLRDLVVAAAIVLVGVTLIFGTSWLGLVRALRAERGERIRSQERAEMAAHLHDSVLQTLALIQRRAGDDREVATLARRQERELREWLSGHTTAADGAADTLTAALRAMAADVEEVHKVTVEVVTVGEAPLDDALRALVAAAREAAVNAAKFAGTGRVDVYAEAVPGRVEVFVRDRGTGFELDSIPAERRGVRESILGRMRRHGGSAEVRTGPGEGTEVELVMTWSVSA